LHEVAGNLWSAAIVRTCIIHSIRNTFRLAPKRGCGAIKRAIRPISTAISSDAAAALTGLEPSRASTTCDHQAWRDAWEEFITFLD